MDNPKVYRIHFATGAPQRPDGRPEENLKLRKMLTGVALTFGGYTLQTNVGGYVMKNGELCEEASYTLILAPFSERSHHLDVIDLCKGIIDTFDQESVMLEYDGRAVIHTNV